jgi:predicted DCC family thiol-disulfide oxidoreductase YuxK
MKLPCDNLILFDGVCNFCASSVRFIIRHDKHAIFKFVSIQSQLGKDIYKSYEFDLDDMQTFLVLTNGQAFLRSDAAIEITRRFGGIWKIFLVFKIVPRSLRDWFYSILARNRYRWFGRRDSCLIPTEDIKQRFLA